jgi:predicted ArsR family transcriptional regulator
MTAAPGTPKRCITPATSLSIFRTTAAGSGAADASTAQPAPSRRAKDPARVIRRTSTFLPLNYSKTVHILNYKRTQRHVPRKHLLNQAQLESLTSPVRLAIVQRLEVDKEATARELARRMGRSATSLYHHLQQLEDIGVLRVVAERKGARRPEAVYAMVADQLSSAEAVKTRPGRETYSRTALRVAEAGARAVSTAIADGSPRFEGDQRNAMVRYFVLRADKKKMARLNRILGELEEAAVHSCDDGDEIQLTLLMSPLPSKD